MDEEQIINGKTIEFGTSINTDIVVPLNTKEDIKDYIFHYINGDFQDIKKYAKKRKVRLSNDDMWKCFLISFKRCKILFDHNKVYYNKVFYNMDDNEEKDFFMEYLKLKNLSLCKDARIDGSIRVSVGLEPPPLELGMDGSSQSGRYPDDVAPAALIAPSRGGRAAPPGPVIRRARGPQVPLYSGPQDRSCLATSESQCSSDTIGAWD